MIAQEPRSESMPSPAAPRLRAIGIGEWGARAAALFDRRGMAAGVDVAEAHALAADSAFAEMLGGGPDLIVVAADLGGGNGPPTAPLLARIADTLPHAARLLVARLPGLRSGPEERALGLVALNAVLEGPPAGIFLVAASEGAGPEGEDESPALLRLLELWALAGGSGHPIEPLGEAALGRFLGTPGFLGWRETTLADEAAGDGRTWHERLAAARWQPEGFAWSEAQAVLPLAKLPWTGVEGGGRRQFERFMVAAWEEAAPCELVPALYAAEPPSAIVVSAGMPYPRGVLALRDSVEEDRARLEEKRRKAGTPIPLGEDFLPEAAAAEALSSDASRVESLPVLVAPEPAQPTPRETDGREASPAYGAALALVRRIFSMRGGLRGVDLGEVRYALYDLLEVLREEPHALLPEVFRPVRDGYFERHHVNVAILATLAGDRLKGSLGEVVDVGTAALLHDVGMLPSRRAWEESSRLPPHVFNHEIRPHPTVGFHRLQEISGMTGSIARMVLEEHERMDGTGYPQGLAGDAIDPGARILAACDTLEALTHPRPYREPLSLDEAMERLEALAEHALDRQVVEALTDELARLLRHGAREPEPH